MLIQFAGGVPPYSYSFNDLPYDSLDTASLASGEYFVSARDGNGCSFGPIPFVLYQPSAINLALISFVNVDCFGNPTGSIYIQGYQGKGKAYICKQQAFFKIVFLSNLGSYQYQIDSQGWNNASLGTTDHNFTGVYGGSHTISIKDTKECQKSIFVTITEPPLLQVQLLPHDPIFCWSPTVDLSLGGIGGTAPYFFG